MKKIYKSLGLSFLAVALCALSTVAADKTGYVKNEKNQTMFTLKVDVATGKAWLHSISASYAVVDSTITVPDSVTITDGTFPITGIGKLGDSKNNIIASATKLKTLVIGKNIEYIGPQTIQNNSNLEVVKWAEPKDTTAAKLFIQAKAFYNNAKLKEVSLPVTLDSLNGNPFVSCLKLTKLTVGTATGYKAKFRVVVGNLMYNASNLAYYGIKKNGYFANQYTNMSTVTKNQLGSGFYFAAPYSFYNLTALNDLSLMGDMETVETQSFYNAPIKTLAIGKDMKYFADDWNGTSNGNLATITLDTANVTFGLANGFLYKKENGEAIMGVRAGIDTLTVPNEVKKIASCAFVKTAAKVLVINEGTQLEEIESKAFSNSSITTIVVNATVPPVINIASDAFGTNAKGNIFVYVPKGSEDAYRASATWGDFAVVKEYVVEGTLKSGQIVVKNGSKELFKFVPDDATKTAYLHSVTQTNAIGKDSILTIPDAVVVDSVTYLVTAIGNTAKKVKGVTSLSKMKKLIVGANVNRVAYQGISNNAKLTAIQWNDKPMFLEAQAIYNNASITTFALPANLDSLNGNPLIVNRALTSITLSSSNTKFALLLNGIIKEKTAGPNGLIMYGYNYNTASVPLYDTSKSPALSLTGYAHYADYCYFNSYNATSLSISDATVKTIGKQCFANAPLKTLTISKAPNLESIPEDWLQNNALTSIVVDTANCPNYGYEGGMFYDKRSGVALAALKNQKTYVVPENVTRLGNYLLSKGEVESIELTGNVKEIGTSAFANSALTKIIVKDTVPPTIKMEDNSFTSIAYRANIFVIVPEGSAAAYKASATWKDFAIVSANVQTGEKSGDYIVVKNAEGKDAFKFMPDAATSTATLCETTSDAVVNGVVSIPDEVKVGEESYTVNAIGEGGVDGLDAMETLEFGQNIGLVQKKGIANNPNMTKIQWNATPMTLDAFAIFNNVGLKKMDLPASLDKMNGNPIIDCPNVSPGIAAVNPKYKSVMGILQDKVATDTMTMYGYDITSAYTSAGSYQVTSGYKIMADYCGYNMYKMKALEIGGDFISIGEMCFANAPFETIKFTNAVNLTTLPEGWNAFNTSLKSIVIDSTAVNFTFVDNILFNNKTGVALTAIKDSANVVLPAGVKTIGKYLFYGDTIMTKVTVPVEVTAINDFSFQGCKNLETVVVKATDPATIAVSAKAFDAPENMTLIVPKGSADAYRAAEVWKNFKAIEEEVTTSVNDIEAEADDANAVYYNLKGVRVAEPQEGDVYVKVAGSKAVKVKK